MITFEFHTDEIPIVKAKVGGGTTKLARRLPRKNDYWNVNPHTGGLYRTPTAKAWRGAFERKATSMGLIVPGGPPHIASGTWRIRVLAFAPRLRRKGGTRPNLDADACLSPVKDCLTQAGIIDDDKRFCAAESWVAYRQSRPGLLVVLEIVDPIGLFPEAWGVQYLDGT